MKPQVSVIISVRNQSKFVGRAIKSILAQTLKDFELLIVDDASADATARIVKNFKDKRIKLITNEARLGLAASINLGLKKSTGKYIARMDADDVAHPKRLKIQRDYLDSHPQVALCGSQVTLINPQGKKIGTKNLPQSYHQIKRAILSSNPFIHPSVMLRRKIFSQIGLYDESLNGAEDYDLWLRIAKAHPVVNLSQNLLRYTINPQGISWSSLKNTEVQALKARVKALTRYHYPLWQVIFLLKPLISLAVPARLKKAIFQIN